MSMPLLKVFGKQEFGDWVDGEELYWTCCLQSIFTFLLSLYIYCTCVESRQLNANEYWEVVV